ncbi:hypothetical protein Tco_0941816 [Tanacetum coccineum]|uniref:Reverse transcriptase Ty1/copia-type domain-containing protein n=1 Tax=Tanacetum coccineum TaxID=301880 RepID=A0ABQ5DRY8_9ASTR
MSMMGELKFFLRTTSFHHSPAAIFISQSQYAIELLKKHGLDADLQGTPTDQTTYRRMIGGLMYLTASRQTLHLLLLYVLVKQSRPTSNTSKEVESRKFRVSKKQDCTAMSTAEAEYVSLSAMVVLKVDLLPHPNNGSKKHSYAYVEGRTDQSIAQRVEDLQLSLKTSTSYSRHPVLFASKANVCKKCVTKHCDNSLHHPTSSTPTTNLTKIIISHYMTIFPEISRRARDIYHNLQDDDIMKNIFNSGRNKDKVGMQIRAWIITDEMKQN